jgi:glycosyltransferase involved in cell wall biosynthesis
MSAPMVSVVIAAWNCGAYLPQTLASALGQTWRNLEVILVDDGSTDDTLASVAPFLPQIRYERREHRGLAAARNEGIQLARGEYIALLDADDLWHPEKITIQVAIAERHPLSGLIASDGEEFCGGQVLQPSLLPANLFTGRFATDASPSPVPEVTGDFYREMIAGCMILCPAQVLLPRRVVERIGPFIDSGSQDWDYYIRVSKDYPVTFHRDVLARWRYRPDSMAGPRADRRLRCALSDLPVLLAHRGRCRPEDAQWLERQIRLKVRRIGHLLTSWGRRENRRFRASSLILNLLLEHPWPPILPVFLLALWSPNHIYRIGARMYHRRRALNRLGPSAA